MIPPASNLNSVNAPSQAPRHARAPGIDGLPRELLLDILQNLELKDLRAFSASSKNFYTLACAAALYISRKLFWTPPSGFSASLTTLDDIVDHAQNVRPELRLAVSARFIPSRPDGRVPVAAVLPLLASLTRGLPFIVRLDLSLPVGAPAAAVSTMLSTRGALHLKTVRLKLAAGGIPSNLLNGDAPMLRKFSLDIPDRATLAAPALRNVTRLLLLLKGPAQNLRVLWIWPSVEPQTMTTIDVAGLRLDQLALDGDGVVLTDTSDIRVLEHRSNHIAAFWPAGDDEFCARAECAVDSAPRLSFGPRGGAWRRTVAMTARAALPLPDAPALAQRLVSLTLDKTARAAARRDRAAVLAAARAGPRGLHRPRAARALPRVVFTAPGKEPVAVRPNKITRLARALGLPDQQAALTIAGCTFFSPPVWPVFQKVFSGVSVVGSAGAYVPAYYDACKYSRVLEEPGWLVEKDI